MSILRILQKWLKNLLAKGAFVLDININRYKLVHDVAKLAKEMEEEDRNSTLSDKKNNMYKEVNKAKKRRNYVLEAFNEMNEKKVDDVDAEWNYFPRF